MLCSVTSATKKLHVQIFCSTNHRLVLFPHTVTILATATGSPTWPRRGGKSLIAPISKKDLRTADQRFRTRRAQYLYLAKLGYSQAQIANAHGVSKRAVWNGIHSPAVPLEKAKLERYRVMLRRP